MSDLISRDALKEELARDLASTIRMSEMCKSDMAIRVLDKVDEAPAVDAVPVVHARWVKAHGMMPPEYHHRKQCSMCGGWALQDYFGRERMSHYCPNCGAKMDGGAE